MKPCNTQTPPKNGMLPSSMESVVISGISGRFPESSNVEEFKKHLFEGIDMVTEDNRRWPPGLYGLPLGNGKLKDLALFDADFFGVHAKQAQVMDPALRIILELTYEAIVDAGVNPTQLRGSRTAVFLGILTVESLDYYMQDPNKINGYNQTGTDAAMLANRISYAFDFHGPSATVCTGCSSSSFALHLAETAIKSGHCDAAIVGSANLLLNPKYSLGFHRLRALSPDGRCKAFDDSANGYVRSEAAAVVFLQKFSLAKRIYATVVKTKSNSDGNKQHGITYPSYEKQLDLLREIYSDSGVNPLDVTYVEAHGTGTKVGDPQECKAIADFFCKNRKGPILVGSVKSNMGHAESAGGLCSIIKMIISMETEVIPGNLHFKNPNPNIPSLMDGRLKVVNRPALWQGGLMAVNSFGYGGTNVHAILQSNQKRKVTPTVVSRIPKIVGVSGRTEGAVCKLLDKVKEHERDAEFVSMVQDLHNENINGHLYRGYQIFGEGDNLRETVHFNGEKRPIWYVFSGMGSQWSGMGKDLFAIDPFYRTILRCDEALKPHGINLVDLLENSTIKHYDNILTSIVTIAAIQVALVEVLKSIDIQPDGIVGHSLGELGCAYADGTMTPEETVLVAYWRGRCTLDSKLEKGAMAAVGLSWEEAMKQCPSDVFPACHNSSDSVTISGPAKSVAKFVAQLKSREVFATEVNCGNFAFHCRYILPAAPRLKEALDRVLVNPKKRSSKWVTSSLSESQLKNQAFQYSSADYFVNNFCSPVLFHEALKKVPDNAIVIEIAPHGFFLPILRKSLPKTVSKIGLQKRNVENSLRFLLESLGKLYTEGGQPKFAKLYPPISYPIGRGTPMLNSVIGWDHSVAWQVPKFVDDKQMTGQNVFEISLENEEDAFLAGHTIDGRVLFPATGYLVLAWKTLAKLNYADYEKMGVIMEDVQIHRTTIIPKQGTVKFVVSILDNKGEFRICENETVVTSGRIRIAENVEKEQTDLSLSKKGADLIELSGKDIYKEFNLIGYEYHGIFKGIVRADSQRLVGELKWNDEWISYMDTMLQFSILEKFNRQFYLPTGMQQISINPEVHKKIGSSTTKGKDIPVYNYSDINTVKSGGIEVKGLKVSLGPKRQKLQDPVYQRYTFVPYDNDRPLVEDPEKARFHAITVLLNIARYNLGMRKLKITEVTGDRPPETLLSPIVVEIMEMEPQMTIDVQIVTNNTEMYKSVLENDAFGYVSQDVHSEPIGQDLSIAIAADVLTNNHFRILQNLRESIKPQGFIILEETDKAATQEKSKQIDDLNLIVVARQTAGDKSYVLLKKQEDDIPNPIVIRVEQSSFSWVNDLKEALRKSNRSHKIILVNQKKECSGIVGLVTCLKVERPDVKLQYLFVQDDFGIELQINSPTYAKQLNRQVVANVLKNGQWGSYQHLRLDEQQKTVTVPVEHAYVDTKGDLSSLRWIESPLKYYKPGHSSSLCYVYYSALNFKDIMLATGKLPPEAVPGDLGQETILGVEFSGRDSSGRRVMGIVGLRGLATTVLADSSFLWEVPDKWTLEQAATIPVVYSTSYYALCVRGGMKSGETVLIHAGSGGVGQASIAIALHMGCTVFTTVGSQEKRNFLKKAFPQLSDSNIGNSRDTSFVKLILTETRGRGVDIVLNSLAEEKLQASIRCLAEGGRFLEIGKYDLTNNNPLGMSIFLKNTSFHGIFLDTIIHSDSEEKTNLVQMLKKGIAEGVVKPLPVTVFSEREIEQAFRYMAAGKHIGKVLVKIRDEYSQLDPQTKTLPAIPRTYFNPEKSYILLGGLADFGLELANWMITRGAKHIVLASRSGIKTGYQSLCIRRWREGGANVVLAKSDIENSTNAVDLVNLANKCGPVGGIFNLAMVLRDHLMENQTVEDFKAVGHPKIDGTIHLDEVSRKMCSELDYFVCFSSLVCGKGNIGQTNYGFANSVMERIVEQRRADGLPGLAIQWGPVGGVGFLAEIFNKAEIGGTLQQRMASCLQTMDFFLQQPHSVLLTMVLAEKHKPSDSSVELVKAVANILSIKDLKRIDQNRTLADLGMDSLIGTEIKQTLERNYNLIFSPQEIRDMTFATLSQHSFGSSQRTESEPEQVDFFFLSLFTTDLIPKETLLKMKSAGEIGSPIFVIHGIDGNVSAFKQLVAELNRPVWGLQCTKAAPLDNLSDLAEFYIKEIKKVQIKGPYTLIGYSFGACAGFEMAVQLQKLDDQSNLILIDGSPDFAKIYYSRIKTSGISTANIAEEQDGEFKALIAYFCKAIDPKLNFSKVCGDLKQMASREDVLNKVVDLIGKTSVPDEDLKVAANIFYKKSEVLARYEPREKYKGPITLFRAKDKVIDTDNDLGLSKICTGNIHVEMIEANHMNILTGSRAKRILEVLQL